MAYLLLFSLSLIFSLFTTRYVRDLAHKRHWLEVPRLERHMHRTPVPRLGGAGVFASFVAVVVVGAVLSKFVGHPAAPPLRTVFALVLPAALVFLLGLYDDLRGASPFGKFAIQGVAAAMLYFGGFGVHRMDLLRPGQDLPMALGLSLTIFWVVLITNAFNLIDGLDGLAAGSALFSTLVVLVLSLVVSNPSVMFFSVILAGAIMGFLHFNFQPASIFLGDSGSLFIGFMLSALALAGSQKAPTMVAVAIPVVSLGLPIVDVLLAVTRRFLAGRPLFKGDSDHIHHRLLRRGFTQRDAVLILYSVTAAFGFLSLVLLHGGRSVALVLSVVGIGIFFGVHQLRYREFEELFSVFQRWSLHRQSMANHLAVRNASDSLSRCDAFTDIGQVLQHTLQPAGFGGVRLRMCNPNGFLPSSFAPFRYTSDGGLTLLWSPGVDEDPPWELRMELVTSSGVRWGYLTLIRNSSREPLPVDINLLAEQFCTSLSDAIERACAALEDALKKQPPPKHQSKTVVAGSLAD